MKGLLKAIRGARLLREGWDKGLRIRHYLLPNGDVLEIVG